MPFEPLRLRSRLGMLMLALLTAGLMSLLFEPIAFWPAAYVCLVPWVLVVVCSARNTWMYVVSYLAGFVFFLANLQWLWDVAFVPIGGWHCPVGAFGLAVYLAVYFPLAAWPIHHMAWRRGVPMALILPIVWVTFEVVRGIWVLGGFPWFFLGHSHYQVHSTIQVSDLVGAYGVSFVLAMVNGCIVDLLIGWLLVRRRPELRRSGRVWASVVLTLIVVTANITYGRWRLDTEQIDNGPIVAVVQQDYPLTVLEPGVHPFEKLASYLDLGVQAAQSGADLIAFPETAWGAALNGDYLRAEQLVPDHTSKAHQQFSSISDTTLRALARGDGRTIDRALKGLQFEPLGAQLPGSRYVLAGAFAIELYPTAVYPKVKRYNSAFLYEPTGREEPQRYDKVHLVMFGEYVPFRYHKELHWLYQWINSITPWGTDGYEYSLTPGSGFGLLSIDAPSRAGQTYHFGVPICYEDCMPYACREFVSQGEDVKHADFLLNISNDGWFGHSAEHEQHLAICVFRAVENRVGIARAVNTGVSAFIDPLGRIYDEVTDDGRRIGKGVAGVAVQPIRVCGRLTAYTRMGDWFGYACCIVTALIMAESVVVRLWRRLNSRHRQRQPDA